MSQRDRWFKLLNAAMDQPRPTLELKRAIASILRQDPVILPAPSDPAKEGRPFGQRRLLNDLAAIQEEYDERDGAVE